MENLPLAEEFLRERKLSFEFPLSESMRAITDQRVWLVDTFEADIANAMRDYALIVTKKIVGDIAEAVRYRDKEIAEILIDFVNSSKEESKV